MTPSRDPGPGGVAPEEGGVKPSALPDRLIHGGVSPSPGARPPGDDAAAVARARDGDLAAFESLVRRHQERVFRTLMGILGRREDAEDAVQATFLKVFRHLGTFKGDAAFSTWVTRIAINEGIERRRARRDHEPFDETDEPEEPFLPRRLGAWADDPEASFGRLEMREMVEREILSLPPRYRVVVILRDIEHLSAEEAAAALGMPVASVKTRLLRARLMLREALAPHFSRRRKGPADA